MDDRNFDEKSALEWIKIIEDEKALSRKNFLYPALNTLVANPTIQNILDIGCGQGVCSDHLDLANRTYTGLEPSDFLLARAQMLYPQPNRKFVKGSAYALPFEDRSFDCAYSIAIWHLLENTNLASSELARILKVGSPFLVVTANPDKYEDWKKPYTSVKIEGRRLEGQTLTDEGPSSIDVLFLHTMDELFASFKQASLSVDRTEPYGPFIYIWGQKP